MSRRKDRKSTSQALQLALAAYKQVHRGQIDGDVISVLRKEIKYHTYKEQEEKRKAAKEDLSRSITSLEEGELYSYDVSDT